MESFFVSKFIKIKASQIVKQVVAVNVLVHLFSKNWGNIDRILDSSWGANASPPLVVVPEVSVEDKHIDTCSCSNDLNTAVIHLVLRGKDKVLTIEEDLILWQIG